MAKLEKRTPRAAEPGLEDRARRPGEGPWTLETNNKVASNKPPQSLDKRLRRPSLAWPCA